MPAISLLKKADGAVQRDGDKAGPSVKWKLAYGHVPVKRSINFATVGEKPIDWRIALPAILAIIVMAGVISKVTVLDRFAALNAAYEEVYQLQELINQKTDLYNSFPDISEDYAHYTVSDMTDEERNRISRVTVMNLVQQVILPVAPLDAWELSENQLSIHISNNTLTEITSMMENIRKDPSVLSCSMQSASTTFSTKDNISTEETITAEVDIYFKTTTQIQKEAEEAKAAAEAEAKAAELLNGQDADAQAAGNDGQALKEAASTAAAIDGAIDNAADGIGGAIADGIGGAAARAAAGIEGAVSQATGIEVGAPPAEDVVAAAIERGG